MYRVILLLTTCLMLDSMATKAQEQKGATLAVMEEGYHPDSIQKRIALIIGNANYNTVGTHLNNPIHDADSMEAVLKELGFTTRKLTDASREDMLIAIREFRKKLSEYNVALFYYSGHGIQVGGENYLIPIDAKLVEKESTEDECVPVHKIVNQFEEHSNNTNIIILDACRNNPFRSWDRGLGGEGLHEMTNPPFGTIISFATGANQTASDGKGINGLFTQELIRQMRIPNEIKDVFMYTRVNVRKVSKNAQIPMEWTQLQGKFYLISPSDKPVAPVEDMGPQIIIPEPKKDNTVAIAISAVQGLIDSMVEVEGGIFTMGCIDDKTGGCSFSERPEHTVNLRTFKIGKYEVTQAQWRALMDTRPASFQCEKCPVEQVTYSDVETFITKLNAATGRHFRLPTEAEWEFAARGGTKSRRYKYSGGNEINIVGWNYSNSDEKPHLGGSKLPNELGIYDMSGNVWEWCSDWYSASYYENCPRNNPTGPATGIFKVLRGSSWREPASESQLTSRSYSKPMVGTSSVGFRLAEDQ